MALNPNYVQIANTFVQQYYAIFDGEASQRDSLINFYSDAKSLMTFEGMQIMGKTKIQEKIQSLTFKTIAHIISNIDAQPTFDGGILIQVLGQFKTDDDPPHTFNQCFVLKPVGESFYVEHDIFRIAFHNA